MRGRPRGEDRGERAGRGSGATPTKSLRLPLGAAAGLICFAVGVVLMLGTDGVVAVTSGLALVAVGALVMGGAAAAWMEGV